MSKTVQQKKLNRILHVFKDKCSGIDPSTYKSFSAMRRADKKYTIQLMFGYNDKRNPIYSKPIDIKSLDTFIDIQKVLDYGLSVDVVEDDLFDGLEDKEEDNWS